MGRKKEKDEETQTLVLEKSRGLDWRFVRIASGGHDSVALPREQLFTAFGECLLAERAFSAEVRFPLHGRFFGLYFLSVVLPAPMVCDYNADFYLRFFPFLLFPFEGREEASPLRFAQHYLHF